MFALYRLSHFVMSPNFRSSCTSPSVLYLFDPLKIGFCSIICLPLQIGYSLTGCSIGYSSLLWSTSCFHYLFGVRINLRIVDVVNICMRVPNIKIEVTRGCSLLLRVTRSDYVPASLNCMSI